MADERKLAHAKEVFNTLCNTLDKDDWKYEKYEEDLVIQTGVQGEDLPIRATIKVDADRSLIVIISKIPFNIQEDKRLDVAVAVSAVNNRLVDGSFDFNIATGDMYFRMTNSFLESEIGADLFIYSMLASFKIIDEYNDKFLMVSKGVMSIEQFLSSDNN